MSGQAERVFELQSLTKKISSLVNSGDRKIFAFTSGKGGTGKTFLSVNTAYALATMGKRVLVIDFDFNFSNVHILVNELPERTLFGFFTNRVLLKEIISEVTPNLSVIYGDSGVTDYPPLTAGAIAGFFRQLRTIESDYDIIILDTASGAGKETLQVLSHTDHTVVIATPEPTAVMDAYVLFKLLDGLGYQGEKSILINKSDDEETAQTAYANLQKAVNHFLHCHVSYLGFVNNDEAARRSILAQLPLVQYASGSVAAKQIAALSSNLLNYLQLANIQQAS